MVSAYRANNTLRILVRELDQRRPGFLGAIIEQANKAGANEIFACFTHGVLSGKAMENIRGSHLKKVIVTNTIPISENGMPLVEGGQIEVLSVAKLLASAIKSIHDETSVSSLFI